MKVSAVLVGVNVAATLSVAAQHPAAAQDQHPAGGTAAFLKSSLTEAAPAPISLSAAPQSLGAKVKATPLSSPRAVATRKALNQTPSVKLRPFVANRKLPSKSDIAMSSQVAEIDYGSQPTTLDGGVTEYSNYYMSEVPGAQLSPRAKYAVKQQQKKHNSDRLQQAAKVASSFVRQVAPRAVPGASPAIPGSVGMPCAEPNYNNLHNPVATQMSPSQMMQQMQRQYPTQFAQPTAFQAPPEPPMGAPRLSPQEQLEMNKLVETACLQQGVNPYASQQPQQSLYQRVGPPPFPLSLIPEDTMKGFLKGARDRKSPIAGSNLAAASGGSGVGMGGKQPLPAGGFHTYMAQTSNQGFGNFSRLPTAMPLSKHPVQAAAKAHPHHAAPVKKVANTTVCAPNLTARPEAPKNQILVYPPYRSQVNFGS